MRFLIALLVALVALAHANDNSWQLEKLATDVAERLREAQRVDRDSFLSSGRAQCADIVLSTMRDVGEAEAIVDLMQARIHRQNFSANWLSHDLKTVVKVAENIVNYNGKVRDQAWRQLTAIHAAQRKDFQRRARAIARAMNVVGQLNTYYSHSDAAAAAAAFAGASNVRAAAAIAAASASGALPVSVPMQNVDVAGGHAVVGALPLAPAVEDERFFLSFLETETEVEASAATDLSVDAELETDLGLGKAATAADIAAAVANVTRVHLYDRDSSVVGLFGALGRFLSNGAVHHRVGFNPYTLRMLHSVREELTAHRHGLRAFAKLAAANFGQYDRFFALAARRPLTLVDITPLQAAVVRAQQRLALVQQGLRANTLALGDMKKISAQYKRALRAVRDDCVDANDAYRRRSMLRKKALTLVETVIYPHVGAYGDLLGLTEAEEVVRALAKVDPLLHVNGAWSAWRFGECDAPCGLGRRTLTRACDSPAPVNGGMLCAGRTRIRNYPCNVGLCTPGEQQGCPVAPAAPQQPTCQACAPKCNSTTPSTNTSTPVTPPVVTPNTTTPNTTTNTTGPEQPAVVPGANTTTGTNTSTGGGVPAGTDLPPLETPKPPTTNTTTGTGANTTTAPGNGADAGSNTTTTNTTTTTTTTTTTVTNTTTSGPNGTTTTTNTNTSVNTNGTNGANTTSTAGNTTTTAPNGTTSTTPSTGGNTTVSVPDAGAGTNTSTGTGGSTGTNTTLVPPPVPGANDTHVAPVDPPGNYTNSTVRPGFAPGSLAVNQSFNQNLKYEYVAEPRNVTSASFVETTRPVFVALPKIDVGSTPVTRGSYPTLAPNADAVLVADNNGNVYTFAPNTTANADVAAGVAEVWTQAALPVTKFQVGFGQSSVLSPDGKSAVICSKWRCALYEKHTQPKPVPLPTLNNTNPVSNGNDVAWALRANLNNKVVRFPRPAVSADMASVLLADRCQLYQFTRGADGAFTELPALAPSQYDCRAMGWGSNTAATLAAISGDGRTRVFVGSCARRAFCNDDERFSLVYVFVDGKRVARTVVPSATLSSAAVSHDGQDIVLGAPVDRTSFHLVRLADASYQFVYVDPQFARPIDVAAYEQQYRVAQRTSRYASAMRAAAEPVRTPAAAQSEALAQNPGEVQGNHSANATAAANSTAAANATGKAFVESETTVRVASDADVDAEAEGETEGESEEEADADADADAEAESDAVSFVEVSASVSATAAASDAADAHFVAQLNLALAREHAADMRLELDMAAQHAKAGAQHGSSLLESLSSRFQTAAARMHAQRTASSQRAARTVAQQQAQSQIESAKTIELPTPHESSVELFFGNRVGVSADGIWMCVQALRMGRVAVDVYSRALSPANAPERQFKLFQQVYVPWSTPTDFDGGLALGANATTITVGTVRGAVALITRATTKDKFTVPEMKWQ